jgi:hypothetical protein
MVGQAIIAVCHFALTEFLFALLPGARKQKIGVFECKFALYQSKTSARSLP